MAVTALQLRKALSASTTSSAFTAKAPTTTKPSGSGVFDLSASSVGLHIGQSLSNFIQMVPYGEGADATTFSLRLWGWSQTDDDTEVWVPQLLTEVSCAISTALVSFAAIVASANPVDTITLVAGDSDISIISPANNMVGSLMVHLRGCQLIEFDFDMTGATNANCLWRVMDQS